MLSEALADDAGVTLIEGDDAFVFGYSKLDVMFGHAAPEDVRLPVLRVRQARYPLPRRDGSLAIDPHAAGDH